MEDNSSVVCWFKPKPQLDDFAFAEMKSLLTFHGVDFGVVDYEDSKPSFVRLTIPERCHGVLQQVCERSVMIKGFFLLYGIGPSLSKILARPETKELIEREAMIDASFYLLVTSEFKTTSYAALTAALNSKNKTSMNG